MLVNNEHCMPVSVIFSVVLELTVKEVFNMADMIVDQPLSVHFKTKHLKRLTHDEVIDEIKHKMDIGSVKSIKITEQKCIVSVANETCKRKLIQDGLRLQNRHVDMCDVNSLITNVTLKDVRQSIDTNNE